MKRMLIGLALLLGAGAVVKRLLGARAGEWQGLTESEVREKLEERIPSRVPDDKRAAVADRVVAKMRDKGALADDDEVPPSSEVDPNGSTEEPKPAGSTREADDSEAESGS